MKFNLGDYFYKLLIHWGVNEEVSVWLRHFFTLIIIVIFYLLFFYISKKIITAIFRRIIKRKKTKYGDIFVKKRVFAWFSNFFPVVVLYFTTVYFIPEDARAILLIHKFLTFYMIFLGTMVINAVINSFYSIYKTLPAANERSIKGYVQVLKIILFSIMTVLLLSVVFNKNPLYFLSGIGVMGAVLMLIFKDTILGLVASIQLSSNKMLKPGDWISMQKYNADGNVIDISLTTVKVLNFDKSISMIPTYALVSDSFQSWNIMVESGTRRIRRSVNIDIHSVEFCSELLLENLKKKSLISDYIAEIQQGLTEEDKKPVNLNLFRRWVFEYLCSRNDISKADKMMVRELQPTDSGIPLEIYAFTTSNDWNKYEEIQSDIIDYIVATAPEFGLKIFQNPSGHDFRKGMGNVV